MSDLLKLLQDADIASLDLEKARTNVEIAKQNLETSKETFEQARLQFEDVLGRAEELGIAKAKVKKLIEERTQGLIASGLMPFDSFQKTNSPKAARSAKKSKATVEDADADITSSPSLLESTDNVVNFN